MNFHTPDRFCVGIGLYGCRSVRPSGERLSVLTIALAFFVKCPKKHVNRHNNGLALEIDNGVACHQPMRVIHVRADLMRN